ncbi:MAG: hypothetical protein K0R36_3369, partial [Chryseobacterium sp.]|nr:hypothetical protein [Chryseobacterium sp.]
DPYMSLGNSGIGPYAEERENVGAVAMIFINPEAGAEKLVQKAATKGATGAFYSVAFEMKLASSSYPGITRYMHFKEANVALESAMKSNSLLSELGIVVPKSASGSIIGKSPTNWVWHHDVGEGVMQLVPKSQHPNVPGGIFWETLHPGKKGGFSIWGK